MNIGKYKLYIIDSGFFALDGGAMFGIIPKTIWQKTNPSDELNRITLATRNLLLVSDSKKILIDTGMGNKWDSKSNEIYKINQNEFSLISSLKKYNFFADDITDVILTHLHFDHTGGSTKIENGKLIPTFPNAKYFVSKKNFDWAVNPSDKDKGSYLKENFIPLIEEGILFFTNEKEKFFDDEIELFFFNGHTFGQQLIRIFDSTNTIFYCGDFFPTSSHLHLPFVMGYDLQPLVTINEKKEFLPKAVDQNWKLFFEHDPIYSSSTIIKTEKGFKAGEKFHDL